MALLIKHPWAGALLGGLLSGAPAWADPPLVAELEAPFAHVGATRCVDPDGCDLQLLDAEDALAGRRRPQQRRRPLAPSWAGRPLPDLSGAPLGVTVNAHVAAYVEQLTGRGKASLATWYARMGRHHDEIVGWLEDEGAPAALIYVCMIESGFDPEATSAAGAAGPWQFTAPTAARFDLQVDDWLDERRDFERSTRAAARYLLKLRDQFGAWPLALAAYNAGPGAVSRAIAAANTNDFWTLVDRGALPLEATRYVPKIMAAVIVGRHPQRFGLDQIRAQAPRAAAVVPTPGGVDLKALARRLKGVSVDELAALNPALRRGFTPPGGDYPLRVPAEARAAATAAVSGGGTALHEYTVRFGERAAEVAQAHGMHVGAFRRVNALPEGRDPAPGQVVLVSGERAPDDASAPLTYVAPEAQFVLGDRRVIYLPVRWTMSLDEIARFFRVPAPDVAMWNGLDLDAPLRRGAVVRLFVPRTFDLSTAAVVTPIQVQAAQLQAPQLQTPQLQAPQVQAPTPQPAQASTQQSSEPAPSPAAPKAVRFVTHTLAKGDRLWNLARAHDTTVDAIRAANDLGPKDRIRVGTKLRIPVGQAEAASSDKASTKRSSAKAQRPRTHTVAAGDSLWKIARRYDVDIEDLKRINKLNSDQVRRGQILTLPR